MKRALLCLLLVAALLLGGCGAMAPGDYVKGIGYAENEANEIGDASLSFSDSSGTVADGRKLIKTMTLHMETENFDALAAEVSRCVAEYGGYVEQSEELSGTSRRSASYTLRIPVARLDEFTADVTAAGVVTRRNSTQKDVTLDYVDIEAHITALNTERDTLLRLLEQAESMEDVITIQDRITQVQYELESYTSRLRTYDNQIDYATISLYISEVEYADEIEASPTVWTQIGRNLKNACRWLAKFFRGLFIVLVSALPYLAVVAVISLPILYFTVFRPAKKRKKARKDQEK